MAMYLAVEFHYASLTAIIELCTRQLWRKWLYIPSDYGVRFSLISNKISEAGPKKKMSEASFTMAIHWSSVVFLSLAVSMAVLSNAEERNAMLLDTEGHPLQSGLDYLILAAAGGKGRGFALTNTCPQYVVQDKSGDGLPVVFHPVCPGNTSLFHRNTAVHVSISAASICENNSEANAWSVARVSGINQTLVKITSGEGLSFMISKIGENEYGIFWCPAVICKKRFGVGPACSALAIHTDNQGNGWVVAGNMQPLPVQFKQAPAMVRE